MSLSKDGKLELINELKREEAIETVIKNLKTTTRTGK